jgi:hypothetical protein
MPRKNDRANLLLSVDEMFAANQKENEMNTAKTFTIVAALVALTGATSFATASEKRPVTIKIETGGTIKVGDYETICDKKPKSCGSDYNPLPPRPKPKPKPSKLIRYGGSSHLPAGYTPIGIRR